MTPRFYTFWSINGPLDDTRLREQLTDMRALGFDGVCFHPRYYPDQPPYLSPAYLAQLSATILAARDLGLEFWLYDENGWPSGTVSGRLPSEYPQYCAAWLELRAGAALPGEEVLLTYTLPAELATPAWAPAAARDFRFVRCTGPALDYLNPAACQQFLKMTHDVYATGLAPAAWDYVSAIFTDEPCLLPHFACEGGKIVLPWTAALPGAYHERHGADLLSLLPALVFDLPAAAAVRVAFWELTTDLFRAGFLAPCDDWCRRHGKLFTGHVKGEEHPLFQVPLNGACSQLFGRFGLPGIDALERLPHHDFYARQVASHAAQFGTGACMAEANGGSGWGSSPADLERYLRWLGTNGLTHFVLHLWQYQLNTPAVRDWPPSQPVHLAWRDAFPALLAKVKGELSTAAPTPDLLVVIPARGTMARYAAWELPQMDIHKGAHGPASPASAANTAFLAALDALKQRGCRYAVTDERTLETTARVAAGRLQVGQQSYSQVLALPECQLAPAGEALLADLAHSGGQVARAVAEVPATAPAAPAPARATGKDLVVPLRWRPLAAPSNTCVLDTLLGDDGTFTAEFTLAADLEVDLVFIDPVSELWLNDEPLELVRDGSLTIAAPEELWIDQPNRLRGRCPGLAVPPFVVVVGEFAVRSRSKFLPGPHGTVATAGPLYLDDAAEVRNPANLLAEGFPFVGRPLTFTAEFTLNKALPAAALRLAGVRAAAAQVTLDGQDLGWCWAPLWQSAPVALRPGAHVLQVALAPSSYNFYGPHHYYRGDAPLLSPGQYTGARNFADPPDAPANTLVPAWHFLPFGLGSSLTLVAG